MFRGLGNAGYAVLVTLVTGSGFGYALAQESADSTVDVVRLEPIAEKEAMSPAERADAVEASVASASATCDAQSRALQNAKRDKDIIRATCLDDKLTQCNANLQTLKRRQEAFNAAVADGNNGLANHEYTVIGVLSQKLKILEQAANQCVGQDLFETGDTRTQSEVDLFAPDESPAVINPLPEWPVPYIPPPFSGVR